MLLTHGNIRCWQPTKIAPIVLNGYFGDSMFSATLEFDSLCADSRRMYPNRPKRFARLKIPSVNGGMPLASCDLRALAASLILAADELDSANEWLG